jgi:hypothetical protein
LSYIVYTLAAPSETTSDTQWRIKFLIISTDMARMRKLPTPLLGYDSRYFKPHTITSLNEAWLPLLVYSVSYIKHTVVIIHAKKAHGSSRGKTPVILNLNTR